VVFIEKRAAQPSIYHSRDVTVGNEEDYDRLDHRDSPTEEFDINALFTELWDLSSVSAELTMGSAVQEAEWHRVLRALHVEERSR
jgi:hypothetical protein